MENTTFASTELEFCKLNINCESLDKDLFLATENEIVEQLKRVKVKGFRKGKASANDIRMSFKKEIKEQMKVDLANKLYFNYLNENQVKPIGFPTWTSMDFSNGKFSCNFVLHTKPDLELKEYKNFTLPQVNAKSKSEFYEEIMQGLRQKVALQEPYSDTDVVEMGDRIMVDFSAKSDGVELDSFKAENELVTVGQSPIPEFDANLIGMKTGETRTFTVLMPKTTDQSVSEKQIEFTISVNMGTKHILPGLDDEFASKFGLENFEALSTEINKTAELRSENLGYEEKRKLITSKLLECNDVKVPSWLIDNELKHMVSSRQIDFEALSDTDKLTLRDACERNIKLSLILEKISSEEPEAQISDQEVIQQLKQQVESLGQDFQKFIKSAKDNYQLPLLFAQIKDDNILKWIVGTSTFSE